MIAIRVGQIAMLKHGGPKMIINQIHWDESKVECVWFDKSNNLHKEWFSPYILLIEE